MLEWNKQGGKNMEMSVNEAAVWIKNLFTPNPEANFPEKTVAIRKMLQSETTASVLSKHDLNGT